MEVNIAKTYKNELQKKIAELFKEFEKTTEIKVDKVKFVRQSQYDSMGNETDYNYAVEVKVVL